MAITVDIQEIKDRYPGTIPYSDTYVRAMIDDAITELYERIPDLDALLESGQIRQESVTKLVAKAVIGAIRNADGFKSESEGDYSYQRYGDGFVWFKDDDIDRLVPHKSAAAWSWVL